jgi:hypothetical protein
VEGVVLLLITRHLCVNLINDLHNRFNGRILKIIWSHVVGIHKHLKRLFAKRLSSLIVLQEVHLYEMVKVAQNLLSIVEVNTVVELDKL